jgi:hypothetical protein
MQGECQHTLRLLPLDQKLNHPALKKTQDVCD